VLKLNQNNYIVITGASNGLGAALAVTYAQDNVTLYLIARNQERLEQVAAKCIAKNAKVFTYICDVCDEAKINSIILSIEKIDLLIANAGVSGGTAGGEESIKQIKTIFDINLYGVVNIITPTIQLMKKQQYGQIAIISSLAGFRGLPQCPSYSASKAAVKVYGEALRGFLAKLNIDVTVVTPGYIKTAMTEANDFYMPLLMGADKAANIIKTRLESNPARISFPFPFYFVVWLISCLPPAIVDFFLKFLPSKKSL
jgi:short-subunit dehydrogenase